MYVWEETMKGLSVHAHCGFAALCHRKINSGGNDSILLIILVLLYIFSSFNLLVFR